MGTPWYVKYLLNVILNQNLKRIGYFLNIYYQKHGRFQDVAKI